jgi:hypothetical protein
MCGCGQPGRGNTGAVRRRAQVAVGAGRARNLFGAWGGLGSDPVVSVTADTDGLAIGFDEIDAVGQGGGEAAIVDSEMQELRRVAGLHDFGSLDGAAGLVLGAADDTWKCDRDSWSSHGSPPRAWSQEKGLWTIGNLGSGTG